MKIDNRAAQSLVAAGALLFLLGLLGGFAIPVMTNPRMGRSAHLEGVMNGTFLLYGSFANWFFITLAAVFGTIALTPIAGAGHGGSALQESLVAAGLVSVGIAMVLGCAVLVFGFYRGLRAPNPAR
jgi:hydroxylaminobenzene mutase